MQSGQLRVLMFGWEFPPHISGGLGTACFGMTSGLLHNNIDVLFVVPRLFGGEDREQFHFVNASDVAIDPTSESVRSQLQSLHYIEINSPIIPYVSPEMFALAATDMQTSVLSGDHLEPLRIQFTGEYGPDLLTEVSRYALVAGTIAAQHEFDVIHMHDWLTYPAGIVAKEVSGKPLVAHVHATEFDRSGEKVNQAVYDLERRGMEAADAVIAVSAFTKQIIIDHYGISADKITVVHNGLLDSEPRTNLPSRWQREKIVTYLGRVTFQKGPDYFIEAARKVLNRFPDVHFVMAGSGDMLRRMIVRAAELRISSRVHFTGFLRGEEIDRLFAISDVYVMPSVSEPFGLSALEAIRSGVPVVISRQAGVAEVLPNVMKVDFWDLDALSNAICALLEYESLTKTFIRESKKDLQPLTWDNAAKKITHLYHQLLREAR